MWNCCILDLVKLSLEELLALNSGQRCQTLSFLRIDAMDKTSDSLFSQIPLCGSFWGVICINTVDIQFIAREA